MAEKQQIVKEIPGFYTVQSLNVLRRTPNVFFDAVPMNLFERIDAIDRVIHLGGAVSPGPVGSEARPWYMHTAQVDNLLVLHGKRVVDIYHSDHGMHQFEVTADSVRQDGELLVDGPAMLTWYRQVFHRVQSDRELGSASLNIALRDETFDLNTNFSVYRLDTETGSFEVIRAGHLDQPGGVIG
jgi:hypothetical protein